MEIYLDCAGGHAVKVQDVTRIFVEWGLEGGYRVVLIANRTKYLWRQLPPTCPRHVAVHYRNILQKFVDEFTQ